MRSCKIADKTGSINASIWDEPGQLIQSGDIVRVSKGYASVWKNSLTLYIGWIVTLHVTLPLLAQSLFQTTGKGGDFQKIGEFCLVFSETPNMSEANVNDTNQPGAVSCTTMPTSQLPTASASVTAPRPPGNGPRPMLNNGGSGWPTSTPSGGNGQAPYRGNSNNLPPKGGNKRDPRKRWNVPPINQ